MFIMWSIWRCDGGDGDTADKGSDGNYGGADEGFSGKDGDGGGGVVMMVIVMVVVVVVVVMCIKQLINVPWWRDILYSHIPFPTYS